MTALVLAQIPHPHSASPITADQFALVGMNNHIINRAAMIVIPLHTSTSGVPNLDRAIF